MPIEKLGTLKELEKAYKQAHKSKPRTKGAVAVVVGR
jgi:hypothetical protein